MQGNLATPECTQLTKQARELLLKQGKTELAKAKFAEARELDANVVFGDEGLE